MQSAYIDTSAFIKRFIVESGSAEVEALIATQQYRLTLSSLSLTEIRSVLKRQQRLGVITVTHALKAIEQIAIELASNALAFQAVDGSIFNLAGDMIDNLTAPLGTLDAVHLASAKAARCEFMITADRQLLRAASEAGLRVVDLT